MANMSFLPEDYLEKRSQRRTNILNLGLFVVVMGAVIGAFLVTDRQRDEVRALKERVDQQFEEAARRLMQLDELQQRKQQMLHKARITATLLERVPRSLILAELVNDMPMPLSLLDMHMETKVIKSPSRSASTALQAAKERKAAKQGAPETPPEPELPPTEVSLVLTGVAPTDVLVAQYMATLSQSPMFKDINLIYSEEANISGNLLRKFNIELKLNQAVNLQDMERKLVRRDLQQNPMVNTLLPPSQDSTQASKTTAVPTSDRGTGTTPTKDRKGSRK